MLMRRKAATSATLAVVDAEEDSGLAIGGFGMTCFLLHTREKRMEKFVQSVEAIIKQLKLDFRGHTDKRAVIIHLC